MKASSAESGAVDGTAAILSLAAIVHYLHTVANAGPTLYFAALPLLAAAAAVPLRPSARERTPRGTLTAFTEPNRSSRPSALGATLTGEGVRVCAVWMAPLLFLTFGHYRDVRYAAPLFPALALALAILAAPGL